MCNPCRRCFGVLALSVCSLAASTGCHRPLIIIPGSPSPTAAALAQDQGDDAEVIAWLKQMRADITRDPTRPGQPVMRVSFWGTAVTDQQLRGLTALKHLDTLDLRGTAITDAGLKELAALPELHDLDLAETRVTDVGLKDLARLKQLRWVNLQGCKGVSQAGASELQRGLPKAHVVYLR